MIAAQARIAWALTPAASGAYAPAAPPTGSATAAPDDDWNGAVLAVHRARLVYECVRAAPDATDASLSKAWLALFLAERRRDQLLALAEDAP